MRILLLDDICCPMFCLGECSFDCFYVHVIAPYPFYMYAHTWVMSSISSNNIYVYMYGLDDPCFNCSSVHVIAPLFVHILLFSPVLPGCLRI